MEITFLSGVRLGAYATLGYLITAKVIWPQAVKLWNFLLNYMKVN